ncbi:MAG: DUF4397 domain-containing protein [Clostridiales bacterium]|nr:DUF4397 domain-containing protein [Clostridiales bacterium]
MFLFRESLPDLKSDVRFFHAAPGAPNIDLYANGNLIISNLAFSKYTDYRKISPGKYSINIYKSGTYDDPILSTDIELLPNTTLTISLILLESKLELFKLKDLLSTYNKELTYLRFINFSPTSPLLSLSLPNGDNIFNAVEYLETTGYSNLSAGIYDFEVTATGDTLFKKNINSLDLENNTFHTIYIVGLIDDKPKLGYVFLKDGI